MNVAVIVPNFNGREALQLCVESIAAYTPEPHRVIVYDDASTVAGELDYLTRAHERGWVNQIIASTQHKGHGHALNVLVNGAAIDADYAVVIDNDIEILRAGWLTALTELAYDRRILAVCDEKTTFGYCSRGYRPEMFLFWFGLLNMTAYRDGMQTDWAREWAWRAQEPYLSQFAPYYPPEDNAEWQQLRATQSWYSDFDREKVIFDPGATLWAKMRYENPKWYLSRPLTPALRASFHHYGHAQSWLEPANEATPRGRMMREIIGTGLSKLRRGSE